MATGSISVSGLLGGTAGQIDVTSLVTNLMKAQSVPKNLLQDQLDTLTSKLTAYQTINTKVTAVQTAARALAQGTTWQATTATASATSVVATSTTKAAPGSTTFDVTRLAASQVTTIAADANGSLVADPSAGITLTGADGTAHAISLTSGTTGSVAAAINAAGLGIRASVVNTDQGTVLQLSSAKTGAANGFTAAGFDAAPHDLVAATDAQVSVGGAGGYTVSSSSNTFNGVIPGVSFSVGALATNVTVSVASDGQSMSDAVQNLVTAVNAAHGELAADSAQGAVLQGTFDVRALATNLSSSVSRGTTAGGSLSTYGIDIDATGKLSFDPTRFAAAYAADPAGTQTAVAGSFATTLDATATAAVDDTNGTVTQAIQGLSTNGTRLTGEIDSWTSRLTDIQSAMEAKYAAMQTALARLQSQQTYLTSMFDSMTSSQKSS